MQDDRENSVYALLRQRPGSPTVLVVANLTPVPRSGYRLGVPVAGLWREALNSDSTFRWTKAASEKIDAIVKPEPEPEP